MYWNSCNAAFLSHRLIYPCCMQLPPCLLITWEFVRPLAFYAWTRYCIPTFWLDETLVRWWKAVRISWVRYMQSSSLDSVDVMKFMICSIGVNRVTESSKSKDEGLWFLSFSGHPQARLPSTWISRLKICYYSVSLWFIAQPWHLVRSSPRCYQGVWLDLHLTRRRFGLKPAAYWWTHTHCWSLTSSSHDYINSPPSADSVFLVHSSGTQKHQSRMA